MEAFDQFAYIGYPYRHLLPVLSEGEGPAGLHQGEAGDLLGMVYVDLLLVHDREALLMRPHQIIPQLEHLDGFLALDVGTEMLHQQGHAAEGCHCVVEGYSGLTVRVRDLPNCDFEPVVKYLDGDDFVHAAWL